MSKQFWFKIHSWVGIKLALLTCFILITGTFAVVSNEIDWLTNSAMRADVSSHTMQWQAIYDSANRMKPEDSIAWVARPKEPWFAAEVIMRGADGERYRLFFHPETAQYQGDGRWYNWQRFFRMTHRHLMMPSQIGITIVCLVGLFIFMSGISGILIYKRWWRDFFRKPRTHNPKLFWHDIHRVMGLWSMWLLFILCITGVWYLLEIWGLRAQFPKDAKPVSVQAQTIAVQPQTDIIGRIIAKAKETRPELDITSLRLPNRANQGIVVQGYDDTILVRERANNLVFDPVSGDLLSVRYASEQMAHVRISEAADPLHFGTFGGLATKLIYFVFGIILSGLAIAGTYLYGMRQLRAPRGEKVAAQNYWRAFWLGQGKWRWLSVLLLTICTALTIALFAGVAQV